MNELNFLDIVILRKIDAESSVEKFGSMINTSFFETANLLGTVKIKGYINIESSVGGISRVTITDAGTSILTVADQRAKEPVEPLDNAILHAVAGGARELDSLQSALGVRSADLAYHINKMLAQGFMDFEVKSAKVYFVLTEMGFNATGGVRVQQTLATPAQEKAASEDEIAGQVAKKKEEPAAPQKKEEKAFTPPWVKPSDVKTAASGGAHSTKSSREEEKREQHKPDVAHILRDDHSAEQRKKEKEREKEQPKKPLTPEEEEQQKKMKRLVSKVEYYIAEYAMYIVIIVVVLLVLIALVFFAVAKLG